MKCLNCGEECKVKFCSRSCAVTVNNRGKRRHGQEPPPCLVCGKKTKQGYSKYCSRKCQGVASRRAVFEKIRRGEYNLAWSGNNVLREFLLHERGAICEGCGRTTWMGRPIPLSVHHEDGDATNNDPKNIFLLCLNCHGITDNYGRKNMKSTRQYRYTPL